MSFIKYRGSLLFFLFACFAVNGAWAQSYWFRHYTNDDGLSYNQVNCAVQDGKGFMWFGTLDGLNRFDGHNFKIFRNDDAQPASIGNNFISALHTDENGTLWVGTHNGLWKYNASSESFSLVDFTFTLWIRDVVGDKRGNLWFICNNYLYKYNIKNGARQKFKRDNYVSVNCSSPGVIWVCTGAGLIEKFTDGGRLVFTHSIPGGIQLNATKALATSQNSLLIGTLGHGLKLFNLQTLQSKDVALNGNTQIAVTDITAGPDNNYWISTTQGIYVYNVVTGNVEHIKKISARKIGAYPKVAVMAFKN